MTDEDLYMLWRTLLVRAISSCNSKHLRTQIRRCFDSITLAFDNDTLHFICLNHETGALFMPLKSGVFADTMAVLNNKNIRLSVEVAGADRCKELSEKLQQQRKLQSNSMDASLKSLFADDAEEESLPLFSAVPENELYNRAQQEETLPLFSNMRGSPAPDFSGEPECVRGYIDLIEKYKKDRNSLNADERLAELQGIRVQLKGFIDVCESLYGRYMEMFAADRDESARRAYSQRMQDLAGMKLSYDKQLERCGTQLRAVKKAAAEMQEKVARQSELVMAQDPAAPLLHSLQAQQISVGGGVLQSRGVSMGRSLAVDGAAAAAAAGQGSAGLRGRESADGGSRLFRRQESPNQNAPLLHQMEKLDGRVSDDGFYAAGLGPGGAGDAISSRGGSDLAGGATVRGMQGVQGVQGMQQSVPEHFHAFADSLGIDRELFSRKLAEFNMLSRMRQDPGMRTAQGSDAMLGQSSLMRNPQSPDAVLGQSSLMRNPQSPDAMLGQSSLMRNPQGSAAMLGQSAGMGLPQSADSVERLSGMNHLASDPYGQPQSMRHQTYAGETSLSPLTQTSFADADDADLGTSDNGAFDDSVSYDDDPYSDASSHDGLRRHSSRLLKNKTFQNYVPDPENRMLLSAALSIASNPGNSNYNPFYIYGGSGLGKTHLLYAIANKIMQDLPGIRVNYTTAEDFIYRYVLSVQKSKRARRKGVNYYDTFRESQVVIIDDVQNFSKAEKSRNAFFEVISEFLEKPNCQLILASDVAPAILNSKGFNVRLTSRFGSGVCCEVMPPSEETRRKIILSKCSELCIELYPALVDFIASNICSNVREIEGAIKTLHSYIQTEGNISPEQAMKVLSSFIGNKQNVPTDEMSISVIKELVARHFSISVDDMESGSKKKAVTTARALAMTLCKDLVYGVTLADIGRAFNKDHSSVSEAIRRIRRQLPADRDLSFAFNKLVSTLKSDTRTFEGNPDLADDLQAAGGHR